MSTREIARWLIDNCPYFTHKHGYRASHQIGVDCWCNVIMDELYLLEISSVPEI